MMRNVSKQDNPKKLTDKRLKTWLEDGRSTILCISGASILGSDEVFVKAEVPDSGIIHLYSQFGCDGQPDINRGLDYVGFYEPQTGKIHGDFTCFKDIADDSCHKLYGLDINDVNRLFKKDIQDMMKSYAFQNESSLMDKAESFYNETGSHSELDCEIEDAISHVDEWMYLRDEPVCFYPPGYDIRLGEKEIYEYIMDSEQFVKRKYEEFVSKYSANIKVENNEISEWVELSYDVDLGRRLIIYHESQKRLTQLKNGADKRLSKLYDIVHAVKELYESYGGSVVNVKITLKKDKNQVSFTYPVSSLLTGKTLIGNIREIDIRPVIDLQFSGTTWNFDVRYVTQMCYRGKVFYKDEEDI